MAALFEVAFQSLSIVARIEWRRSGRQLRNAKLLQIFPSVSGLLMLHLCCSFVNDLEAKDVPIGRASGSEREDVIPSVFQGLNVATTALQLVEKFKLKIPSKVPVEVTLSVAVAAGDVPVSRSRKI
jgi:hypothetical protein